jgi:hypothetical protein
LSGGPTLLISGVAMLIGLEGNDEPTGLLQRLDEFRFSLSGHRGDTGSLLAVPLLSSILADRLLHVLTPVSAVAAAVVASRILGSSDLHEVP